MKDYLYPNNAVLRFIYILGWVLLMCMLFWIAFGAKDPKVFGSAIIIGFLLMVSHIHMMFIGK